MDTKDFFISYSKDDKNCAEWVAGTLEEIGYTVYIQAWDIVPGDDFIEKMNNFLAHTKNFIAISSASYWNSPYCKKEFQTAFDAHLRKKLDKFLTLKIEDYPIEPLYNTTVYIELFNISEEGAKNRLLSGIGYLKNPRVKGSFIKNLSKETTRDITKNRDSINILKNVKFDSEIQIRDILIHASSNKQNGDIFTRAIYDVFHTLGFGEMRTNIHKSGREVDLVLRHRTENKIAVVECKSHDKKIGGDDLNKFIGVLDIESKQDNQSTYVGYFVSRTGFTETAIEQEKQRNQLGQSNDHEVILMGPNEISRELLQGNIICNPVEKAYSERIGIEEQLFLCKNFDLIASENGWIWVLYYSNKPKQVATHYALLHADGHQLIDEIAEKIKLHFNKLKNAKFVGLEYLKPAYKSNNYDSVKNAYFAYLKNELGEIQFEGMPTDQEAGTVKVNLENLFVPLRFIHKIDKSRQNLGIIEDEEVTIKEIISNNIRAAILAKPGGGKSTLIRRIALAYAFPERRELVSDDLPCEKYLPIYIRCRDLGNDATNSIMQIIKGLASRAEIPQQLHSSFDSLIFDALQKGEVLLLIDGLDEISNDNYRLRLVNQLRTFVSIYPTVHLIITSRETGFRAVAGVLTSYCAKYSIASLNEEEIKRLSLNWHRAILGDGGHSDEESKKVCEVILKDQRIVTLAENPLLMTTLLFVKRWIGYLPTKRCRLYEEMIKLLLVTWNAVAHEHLEMEETEPQLAFIAYNMTANGVQKISKFNLEACIMSARKDLTEILGYTRLSPAQFIHCVEERSSLLIQSGFEEDENGKLIPTYEFSHLSFQEYLTAKAISENWLPNDTTKDLTKILNSHLKDENWYEVIPLSAVLSGRKAIYFIETLVNRCEKTNTDNDINIRKYQDNVVALHLANCISSEVPMAKELLIKAIKHIVKRKNTIERISARSHLNANADIFKTILMSKYGTEYRNEIYSTLCSDYEDGFFHCYCDAWVEIYKHENCNAADLASILSLLEEKNLVDQLTGALLMMKNAFERINQRNKSSSGISEQEAIRIFYNLLNMVCSNDKRKLYTASWCIAWSGYNALNVIPAKLNTELAINLISHWTTCDETMLELKRMLSWAVFIIMSPSLKKESIEEIPNLEAVVKINLEEPKTQFDSIAAFQISLLMGYLSSDEAVKLYEKNRSVLYYKESFRFLECYGFKYKAS